MSSTPSPSIALTGDEATGYLRDVAARALGYAPPDAGESTIHLIVDPSLREEQWESVSTASKATIASGSRRGLVYGLRALLAASTTSEGVRLGEQQLSGEPSLPYRLYWTWDHSTNWDILQVGQQESGAFNHYEKQPDAFVSDYRRLIRHMADTGANALVVYGLLRDGHNGLDAARELCAFAKDHGIRLLAGIAANSYGGTYYEGKHPFNLATWLDENPELEAPAADMPGFHIADYGRVPFLRSTLSRAGDSQRAENLAWTLDSVDWLLNELDLGGVNVEFGDYAGNDAHADMKRILPKIVERVKAHDDDLWVVTDLGWDALADPGLPDTMRDLPQDCVYEFTFNISYWDQLRTITPETIAALPVERTILRGQIGTQWNRQRYTHIGQDFAEMAQLAARTGMDGIALFSEVAAFSVPNELNYLAFTAFAADTSLTWDAFVDAHLVPLFGSRAPTDEYLTILDATHDPGSDLAELRARVTPYLASASAEIARRWTWIAHDIDRRIWNASTAV